MTSIHKIVLFIIVSVMLLPSAFGQSISIVSGNGQVVTEQFLTTVPLVVQVKDAAGKPIAGTQITWAVTQGSGTVVGASGTTDANGQASANFLGTFIPAGYSFLPATISATSQYGTANFAVTTALGRTATGALAAPPLVELLKPEIANRNLSGASGAILPDAVVVQVTAQSGTQAGTPVPNVAVRMVNSLDPTATPAANCNVPGGVVLTDASGRASCSLMLSGAPGSYLMNALVGEFQNTSTFTINISQAAPCTYALSSANQSFSAAAAGGSVNVTAGSTCNWAAVSNAPWLTISSGATGTGNGSVAFNVAANTGALRSGTLQIAGQTFTVTQNAVVSGGGGPLAITTAATLPAGALNGSYSAVLVATGGQPPYSWTSSGSLPPGLALNASTGLLSGIPTAMGNYTFNATVTDAAGTSRSQSFTLSVGGQSTGPVITNSNFPSGIVGQPYQQTLTSSGGCATPFAAFSSFRVSSGALPGGLDVKTPATGTYAITGTPTAAGTFNFGLTVTDPCGRSSSSSFTLAIANAGGTTGPALTPSPASLTFRDTSTQILSVTSTSGTVAFTAAASSTGNWLSVTPSVGTTPAAVSVAANLSGLAAGSYNGSITLTPSGGAAISIPVTAVVTAQPILDANPKVLTFTHQFGIDTAEPPRPVSVTSSGGASTFTVITDQPWLAVSPTTGTTPATVNVSVKPAGLSVGTYSGTVQISPTVRVPVTLNVTAPAPTVTSAATFLLGPVAPGEVITIFGSNLGPPAAASLHATGNSIDTVLSDTRVLFDGTPAPLLYVSPSQISVIVPYELVGRLTAQMQIEYKGLRGSSTQVQVATAVPGIFPNAILNQDTSLNSRQNGAEPGSIVVFYATGEGQTDPAGVTGKISADVLPKPKLNVGVQIGGKAAEILYAGSAPGMPAGLMQVNARVPDDIPRGTDVPLVLTVGEFASQSGVTVSIRP